MASASEVSYYWDTMQKGWPKDVLETLTRAVAQYCRVDYDSKKMYIGIASGQNPGDAMKRRYDEYKSDAGINVMIALYESSTQDHCRQVEGSLVTYFENHKKNINRTGGGGGRTTSAPKSYVYLALRTPDVHYYDDTMQKGWPKDVIETLKRAVAQYCREDYNTEKMYIGIASGENPQEAMKRRYDVYKSDEGINTMIALYESSSQDSCRDVEDKLVAYFKEHKKSINRTGGGGGRTTTAPKSYVYLALRISPAGH